MAQCSLSLHTVNTLCVYVPENELSDTQYVHFYLDEMQAAEQTRNRLQSLYPSVFVRVFERFLCSHADERIEDDRPLR